MIESDPRLTWGSSGAGGNEENGRGLMTVAALASKVGYRGTQAAGHVVWAQFDLASP
ncbi:hypothetical protein ACSDR0_18735 [Streptosporangium sp. G11]|uniref:hypothetical protein n=1 Tax=Streptosporangium sp. G11 TaxID=3436926 RepID=UPI003EB9C320